jgi:hypothetical protein
MNLSVEVDSGIAASFSVPADLTDVASVALQEAGFRTWIDDVASSETSNTLTLVVYKRYSLRRVSDEDQLAHADRAARTLRSISVPFIRVAITAGLTDRDGGTYFEVLHKRHKKRGHKLERLGVKLFATNKEEVGEHLPSVAERYGVRASQLTTKVAGGTYLWNAWPHMRDVERRKAALAGLVVVVVLCTATIVSVRGAIRDPSSLIVVIAALVLAAGVATVVPSVARIPTLFQALPVLLPLSAGAVYLLGNYQYSEFFSAVGVSTQEVGVSYLDLLTAYAVPLGVVLLALAYVLVGLTGLVVWALRAAELDRERLLRPMFALLLMMLVTVTAFSFFDGVLSSLRKTAHDSAAALQRSTTSNPRSRHRVLPGLTLHPVRILWTASSSQKPEYTEDLVRLGTAENVFVVYDRGKNRVLRVPREAAVLSTDMPTAGGQ